MDGHEGTELVCIKEGKDLAKMRPIRGVNLFTVLQAMPCRRSRKGAKRRSSNHISLCGACKGVLGIKDNKTG